MIVIYDKGNSHCQICQVCVVGYLRKMPATKTLIQKVSCPYVSKSEPEQRQRD